MVSIEEHVSSVLYGSHGFVDLIFEGLVLDLDQEPNDHCDYTRKILFEIKTGKPKHQHKDQVTFFYLIIFRFLFIYLIILELKN